MISIVTVAVTLFIRDHHNSKSDKFIACWSLDSKRQFYADIHVSDPKSISERWICSQSEFSLTSKLSLQRILESVKRYLSLNTSKMRVIADGMIDLIPFDTLAFNFIFLSTKQNSVPRFWLLENSSVQWFCCHYPIFASLLSDFPMFLYLP